MHYFFPHFHCAAAQLSHELCLPLACLFVCLLVWLRVFDSKQFVCALIVALALAQKVRPAVRAVRATNKQTLTGPKVEVQQLQQRQLL